MAFPDYFHTNVEMVP